MATSNSSESHADDGVIKKKKQQDRFKGRKVRNHDQEKKESRNKKGGDTKNGDGGKGNQA